MGEVQTAETASAAERAGFSLWIKLLFAALAIFSWFVGELNLASIVSRYGFQWHPVIVALVAEYKNSVYPIYDHIFRFVAAWLSWHFSLPATAKDALTIVWLGFVAANAESFIRDKRHVLTNVLAEEGMFSSINRWRYVIYFILYLCSTIAVAIWLDHWISPRMPSWYRTWWFYIWCYIGAVPAIYFWFGALYRFLPAEEAPEGFPRSIALLALLALLGLPAVLLLPMAILFCVGMIILTVFTVTLGYAIVSPFIAWRTVAVTILLFLLMMGVNWIVLHHIA